MDQEEREGLIGNFQYRIGLVLEKCNQEGLTCYRMSMTCVLDGKLLEITVTPEDCVVTEMVLDDLLYDDDSESEEEDDEPGMPFPKESDN